ncbi:hypothetical protein CSPAE12_01900 [Colletotrichum incanum]|nr:hypothetical protein CSPAE12_01900 [Colletotrichum incanum]
MTALFVPLFKAISHGMTCERHQTGSSDPQESQSGLGTRTATELLYPCSRNLCMFFLGQGFGVNMKRFEYAEGEAAMRKPK